MRIRTIETNTLDSYRYARTHYKAPADQPNTSSAFPIIQNAVVGPTHSISDDPNRIPSRQPRHPTSQARSQMDEPAEEGVRFGRCEGTCDEHGDY
jgi:hypothetical protein